MFIKLFKNTLSSFKKTNSKELTDDEKFKTEAFKKAVVSYPPRSVTIGINSACLNKCSFCSYHSPDAKGISKVYNIPFLQSVENFEKIVKMCFEGGVKNIHICGTGEPLLHPEIFEIMEVMQSICGYISIQTSFPKVVLEKKNNLNKFLSFAPKIRHLTSDIMGATNVAQNRFKKNVDLSYALKVLQLLSKSGVTIEAHFILTKQTAIELPNIVDMLARNNIKCTLAVVNIHPHSFNEITDISNVFNKGNNTIEDLLFEAQSKASNSGVNIILPNYFDSIQTCGSLWTRFQIWPVQGIDKKRRHENIIIGGCNAVVRGNFNTLGYIFDYSNIMELWNNEHFIKYRKIILSKKLIDPWCSTCSSGNYSTIKGNNVT